VERHDLIVNVEVAIWRDGRYLAMVRGRAMAVGAGWLVFPGGKVERERDTRNILEATARREVLEEVGLTLDAPVVYVESHTFMAGDAVVLDVVMLARAGAGEAYPASPDEVAEVAWLTPPAFLADPRTQPWTQGSIELAERKRRELGW